MIGIAVVALIAYTQERRRLRRDLDGLEADIRRIRESL
jgi:hypothetical protein